MVLLPRVMPSLVIGLAFFWMFLFVPFLVPLRTTLVSLFVSYLIVGLSYGLRLLQGTLIQVSPELEESARTTGATVGQTWRDIVVPLVRPGLVGAWALIMIVFRARPRLRLPDRVSPAGLDIRPGDRMEVDVPPAALAPRVEITAVLARADGRKTELTCRAEVETALEIDQLRACGVISMLLGRFTKESGREAKGT